MPLPKDQFDRRLDAAFTFLGDLLRNPEIAEGLHSAVYFAVGSASSGEPVMEDRIPARSRSTFLAEVTVPAASARK